MGRQSCTLQGGSSDISSTHQAPYIIITMLFFLRFYFFIFRERGREGEREGNISVWLPLVRPQVVTWPATQACALTKNQTSDPLGCGPALNPLSRTSQGSGSPNISSTHQALYIVITILLTLFPVL